MLSSGPSEGANPQNHRGAPVTSVGHARKRSKGWTGEGRLGKAGGGLSSNQGRLGDELPSLLAQGRWYVTVLHVRVLYASLTQTQLVPAPNAEYVFVGPFEPRKACHLQYYPLATCNQGPIRRLCGSPSPSFTNRQGGTCSQIALSLYDGLLTRAE